MFPGLKTGKSENLMTDPIQLILNFGKSGHVLGKSIEENEADELIKSIIDRLNTSERVLDLSPESLNEFAKLLLLYYQQSIQSGKDFSEEQIVEIIREIAAYFGKVVINNSSGKWRTKGSLWETEIVIGGPVKAKKGNEVRTYKEAATSLGQIAASTWLALQKGVEPKLFSGYKFACARHVKESL